METTAKPPRTIKPFELKKLSPRHKQAASLLAQGAGREQIAAIVGFTPEYITMLASQPLFVEYVAEMTKFADTRLQALFDKSVDVLAETMAGGSEMAKLRAAQQAMTAVGKAGSANLTVKHTHSLVGILQTIPALGSDVPLWNNTDERVVAGESTPLK